LNPNLPGDKQVTNPLTYSTAKKLAAVFMGNKILLFGTGERVRIFVQNTGIKYQTTRRHASQFTTISTEAQT
jgi:hypothetical protein